MKNLDYYIIILFFSIGIISYQSCSLVSPTQYTGHIKGIVRDSTTLEKLDRVHFNTIPFTRDTVSDIYGNYTLDMPLSNSTETVTIFISRIGYKSETLNIAVKSDETKTIDFGLIPSKGIFIQDGLILDQNITNTSFSAVNLKDFVVEQDRMPDVDLKFRNDSTRLYLITGYDNIAGFGYDIKFSNALGTMTKSQFDTLASYYGASDPINPDIDFPNSKTLKYLYQDAKNQVYAIYLKGRYIPGTLHSYGLIHIDSVWTAAGLYKMMIGVKINIVGQNYFISDTKYSGMDRVEQPFVTSATANQRHKQRTDINNGR